MFNNKGSKITTEREHCENVVPWCDLWLKQQKVLSIQKTRQLVTLQYISAKPNQPLMTIKNLTMMPKARISRAPAPKKSLTKALISIKKHFRTRTKNFKPQFHPNFYKTAQKGNSNWKSLCFALYGGKTQKQTSQNFIKNFKHTFLPSIGIKKLTKNTPWCKLQLHVQHCICGKKSTMLQF